MPPPLRMKKFRALAIGGACVVAMLGVAVFIVFSHAAAGKRAKGVAKQAEKIDQVGMVDPPRLEWSKWYKQGDPRNESGSGADNGAEVVAGPEASWRPGERTAFGGDVHSLVEECARWLQLRGVNCDEGKRVEDDFRVPFMESGDLPCGFETRMTNETIDELTSKYAFHFVGDSTTRRVSESFVATGTGEAKAHRYFHHDKDMSSGRIKVMFHWAPFCFASEDQPGMKDAIEHIIVASEERNTTGQRMRKVIITAHGPWDAAKGGGDAAALSKCAEVMQQVVEAATPSPVGNDAGLDNPWPPLVFILQNNPFPPGSKENDFLALVHAMQRQVLEQTRKEEEPRSGVFIVNDRESLYGRMPCYRRNEEIHFLEPVKLVEGKMLWDLVALVDSRGSS